MVVEAGIEYRIEYSTYIIPAIQTERVKKFL